MAHRKTNRTPIFAGRRFDWGKAAEFTRLMLAALLQQEGANRELREAVSRIQEAPFRTGLEELRLALEAPVATPAHLAPRADRFREARNSLDTAGHMSAPDRRALVDFYRGFASFHIDGAGDQTAEHWISFGKACADRATSLAEQARHEDALAAEDEAKAAAIPYERVRGGVGLTTFDRAIVQVKRASLIRDGMNIGLWLRP